MKDKSEGRWKAYGEITRRQIDDMYTEAYYENETEECHRNK